MTLKAFEPVIKGVVVKEVADFPSNWRSGMSLGDFLKLKNIPGIAGIDTRMLTRLIRNKGTMKGAICGIDEDDEYVLSRLRAVTFPADEVKQVSATKPYPSPGRGTNVVVVDFGLKHGILRELTKRGCDVTVVPYHTTGEQIISLKPDGVLLSNGPGDPKHVIKAADMIRDIQGKVPLFANRSGTSIVWACQWLRYREDVIWPPRFKLSSKRYADRKNIIYFSKSWL